MKNTIRLTESELKQLIENIIMESKQTLMQLSNKKTKELERITIPIENFMYQNGFDKEKLFSLIGWYHSHGLRADEPVKYRKEKLIELLGVKPNYHVSYEFRSAVFGFEFIPNGVDKEHIPNNELVIYYSGRGLSIQLHPKFRKDMIINLIDFLSETLIK